MVACLGLQDRGANLHCQEHWLTGLDGRWQSVVKAVLLSPPTHSRVSGSLADWTGWKMTVCGQSCPLVSPHPQPCVRVTVWLDWMEDDSLWSKLSSCLPPPTAMCQGHWLTGLDGRWQSVVKAVLSSPPTHSHVSGSLADWTGWKMTVCGQSCPLVSPHPQPCVRNTGWLDWMEDDSLWSKLSSCLPPPTAMCQEHWLTGLDGRWQSVVKAVLLSPPTHSHVSGSLADWTGWKMTVCGQSCPLVSPHPQPCVRNTGWLDWMEDDSLWSKLSSCLPPPTAMCQEHWLTGLDGRWQSVVKAVLLSPPTHSHVSGTLADWTGWKMTVCGQSCPLVSPHPQPCVRVTGWLDWMEDDSLWSKLSSCLPPPTAMCQEHWLTGLDGRWQSVVKAVLLSPPTHSHVSGTLADWTGWKMTVCGQSCPLVSPHPQPCVRVTGWLDWMEDDSLWSKLSSCLPPPTAVW